MRAWRMREMGLIMLIRLIFVLNISILIFEFCIIKIILCFLMKMFFSFNTYFVVLLPSFINKLFIVFVEVITFTN